jgi:hypothetical protein
LLLEPRFRHGWSAAQGWIWVAGLAIVIVLLANTLHTIQRCTSIAGELPVVLLILAGGTAGALVLSGSLLLGHFAIVLAGALFGTLIFAVRNRGAEGAIMPVFALILCALLLSGYFFADLPILSALLVVTAPTFALMCGRMISHGLWASAVRVILVCAGVAIALFLAFRSSPPLDY